MKENKGVVEVKENREKEQETLFPLAGPDSNCSTVGQKGPSMIIDPPSLPDSLCPRA